MEFWQSVAFLDTDQLIEVAVASEAGMMLSKAQEIAKFLGISPTKGPVAKY